MEENNEQVPNDSTKFKVNRDLIYSVEKQNQELELQDLDITVYDHSTLEKGIIEQVKDALKQDDSEEEGEIREESNEAKISPDSATSISLTGDVHTDSKKNESVSFLENYLKKQSELAIKKKLVKKKTSSSSVCTNNNVELIEEPCSTNKSHKTERKRSHKAVKRKTDSLSPHKVKKKFVDKNSDDDNVYCSSGSEYNPYEDEQSDDDEITKEFKKSTVPERIKKVKPCDDSESSWDSSEGEHEVKRRSNKELDDGDLDLFIKRTKSLPALDKKDYKSIGLEFRVPTYIWEKLFAYQKEGVKWLWGLHQDSYGGILGDEMGLGKTIQMISFLAGLHFSDENDVEFNCHGLGPSIIVCPTTIMHQWVREFHHWYPQIRVAILHESGTFSGKSRKNLIKSITSKTRGVLITSYSGLVQNSEIILSCLWHYVILDEGHKIRNPDAQISKICKNFDTSHRIILSGSPMQNNLKELWSLFDFIVPGKLGSLNIFTASFVTPIVQGGYANASKSQVLTAFKCATALRDTIKPFLLRRSKVDVDIQLPGKKEQVLFCKLTEDQREAYLNFLRTLDIDYVQNNKGRLFGALVTLRKICNHPDLYTSAFHDRYILRDTLFGPEKGSEDDYGYWKRSGKMIVLVNLLKHWDKIGGQKVLIFTQGKKMMLVLENFIKRSGYKYLKLDGGISIAARQPLIDKFNNDTSYFVMLLTTRVGGLGVNLTGANKVVIYDPDWNPATDAQARERAWRIGQSKDVSIYRLLTTGTIEEKMYHRQIFKEFLSNKILKDPKQRRFFKSNDLMELFTLNETVSGGTSETAAIFAGTGSEIKYDPKAAAKIALKKGPQIPKIVFSEKKVEEMKRIAQEMSKRVADLANKNKSICTTPTLENANKTKIVEDIYGPDGRLIPKSLQNVINQKENVEERLTSTTKEDTNTLNRSNDSMLLNSDEQDSSTLNIKIGLSDPTSSNLQSSYVDNDHSLSNSFEKLSDDDCDYEMSFDDILNLNRQKELKKDIETEDTSPSKKKCDKEKIQYNTVKKDKSKKKSKIKHKSKKSAFAMFEGEVVPHLVKCRKVKKTKDDKEDEPFKNHDDYILHKLLKKSGIDTAMKHDAIMDEGPSDYAIVEEESSRIAEEAIKAIQQSYNRNRNPVLQSKNPLMQEIMNKLKERNLQGFSGGPQAQALLTELITYLNSMGGTASTDQLVDKFREKVDSGKSPIFKKLLSNIATFYRAPDAVGYWTIKDDFKLIIL